MNIIKAIEEAKNRGLNKIALKVVMAGDLEPRFREFNIDLDSIPGRYLNSREWVLVVDVGGEDKKAPGLPLKRAPKLEYDCEIHNADHNIIVNHLEYLTEQIKELKEK